VDRCVIVHVLREVNLRALFLQTSSDSRSSETYCQCRAVIGGADVGQEQEARAIIPRDPQRHCQCKDIAEKD
jgi:hypothetical protein